ncbi:hypothetical protein MXB_5286 [Myxobolus squamalis]|nr:hypothetical protein MXB_5286 [Myxobolus squamalis]
MTKSKLMRNVVEKLEKRYEMCKFIRILTNKGNILSEKYGVNKIPTCVLIKGFVPGELTSEIRKLNSTPTVEVHSEINYQELVNQAPARQYLLNVVQFLSLFGGFSNEIVKILDGMSVKYGYFDILTNENVRQGLKDYAKWPTFPQLYVNGNFIGGLDIVRDLEETGELREIFN